MYMSIVYAVIAGVMIMGISFIGKLFARGHLRVVFRRYHHFFLAFSVGVFGVITYSLLNESIEHSGMSLETLLFVLGGFLVPYILIKRLLPADHHHHDTDSPHAHAHTAVDGRSVIISDSIHNIADGLLLVSAFSISTVLGIGAAISIMIHESIQELSEFFVLKEAGYSDSRALRLNFIASSSILIGITIAALSLATDSVEGIVHGVAAGAFIFVLTWDLIPALLHTKRISTLVGYAFSALFGALLILTISTIVPHEEPSEYADTTGVQQVHEHQ